MNGYIFLFSGSVREFRCSVW